MKKANEATITQHELEFRTNLAARLAAIETGQTALSSKIDSKVDLLSAQLTPVIELHKTVQEHDRDISRWKGVNAVLSSLWVAAIGIGLKLKHYI